MNITPTVYVRLPLGGVVDTLDISVNPFTLFSDKITVTWKVIGSGASKEGTLILPIEVVSSWGTDDNVVKNYVLQELGLFENTSI